MPKRRIHYIPEPMRDAIIAAIQHGERFDTVAKVFGATTSAVFRLCRERGLDRKYTPRIHELITPHNIEAYVVKTEGGCWEWAGSRNEYGYPRIGSRPGHRYAYEIFHGPIPEGLHILHKCDNPPCVNPAHLIVGTHVQNMQDCTAKGRRAKGERAANAKLVSDQVREIRKMRINGGFTLQQIADRFKITREAVRQIASGQTWSHIPMDMPWSEARKQIEQEKQSA